MSHGAGKLGAMAVAATSVRFAEAALRLGEACRRADLVVPGFRSPPAHPTADRTLRRGSDGAPIVAVRVRGRTVRAVLTDMVEGVIAANRLSGPAADAARCDLSAAVGLPRRVRAA